MKPQTKFVILDLESNDKGIVFQFTWAVCDLKTAKMSEITTVIVKNKDLTNTSHIKNSKCILRTIESGGETYVMEFGEAVLKLLRFVRFKRLPIVSQSIDRDISFLYESDKHYGSSIFKADPLMRPHDCCNTDMWYNIVFVCSQQMITRSCPKTFALANHGVEGKGCAKLDHLAGVLLNRTQEHNSLQDIKDLFEVLCICSTLDGLTIPKNTFMVSLPYNVVTTEKSH